MSIRKYLVLFRDESDKNFVGKVFADTEKNAHVLGKKFSSVFSHGEYEVYHYRKTDFNVCIYSDDENEFYKKVPLSECETSEKKAAAKKPATKKAAAKKTIKRASSRF
jgi:hypothetical protein